jgi:uncharacterized membrane protein
MLLVYIHLFATFTTLALAPYLLFVSKTAMHKRAYITAFLCATFMISAATGIFLNLVTFSFFHILSVVTLTTIPLGIYLWYKKQYLGLYHSIFNNFLGLCAAFAGALSPGRSVGFRFWTPIKQTFGLSFLQVNQIHTVLFWTSLALVAYFVFQSYKNPKFFKYSK